MNLLMTVIICLANILCPVTTSKNLLKTASIPKKLMKNIETNGWHTSIAFPKHTV